MKRKMVIAGGTGFLGKQAAEHFMLQGWEVVVLGRKPQKKRRLIRQLVWDGKTAGPWQQALEGAEVLLNLSGRSVDCRYTAANRKQIFDSRLDSTRSLAAAMGACHQPPKLWINASTATYYRHAYEPQDEYSGERGWGFSVEVARQWEAAFYEKQLPGVRRVALRLGIVLSKQGGALLPLKRLVRGGLGKRFGNGHQYISWLHEKDFVNILQFLIDTPAAKGIINATAPEPIANAQFLKLLRRAMGVPFGLPLPAPLLELGAWFIRTETELILKSRCVVPRRLQELGYRFAFPEAAGALLDLITKTPLVYEKA